MDQATEQRAQIFSIPNLMSMFRIVLIPFFAAAVLQGWTIAAIALIAVSALTDVADGYVARRFHMVTQLGKLVLALCLARQNPRVWLLAGVMALKEGAMLVLCALFLRRGGRAESSCWYGKAGTAALYAVMTLMLLFPDWPDGVYTGLILLCAGWLLVCGALYIRKYWPEWKRLRKSFIDSYII